MRKVRSNFTVFLTALISVLFYPPLAAQGVYSCDNFDPLAYQPTTEIWDWRDNSTANWEAYVVSQSNPSTNVIVSLRSPFKDYGIFEPNVNHLYTGLTGSEIDYQPSDGWELLYKNFGSASENIAVDNPSFVIYNRFSSQLRVFIYARKSIGQIVSDAALTFGFSDKNNITSLLSYFRDNTSALDAPVSEKLFEGKVLNEYNNPIDGTWLHAQFPTFYDPCACQGTGAIPQLYYEGAFISSSQLDLEGITTSTPPSVKNVSSGSQLNSSLDQVITLIDLLASNKKGVATFKLLSDFKKIFNVKKSNSKTNVSEKEEGTEKKNLPSFFGEFPIVTKYATNVAFLMTSPKKKEGNSDKTPNASFNRTQLTGSISTTGDIQGPNFYLPGTNNENLPGSLNKPIYNYSLGTVSLLEEPVIEYATYQHTGSPIDYFNPQTGVVEEFYDPNIQQYHLKSPPKILINPASELSIVDVKASLVYSYPVDYFEVGTSFMKYHINFDGLDPIFFPLAFFGPVASTNFGLQYPNLSFGDRLSKSGVVLESRPRKSNGAFESNTLGMTFSTGLKNINCLTEESVFLATSTNSQSNIDPEFKPTFEVRLVITMKRNDTYADANTESVRVITTFKAKLENSVAKVEDPNTGNLINAVGTYEFLKFYIDGPQLWQNEQRWPIYQRHFIPTNFQGPLGAGSSFPVGQVGVPFDRTFDNNSVQLTSTEIQAINSISFNDYDESQNNTPSTFRAGTRIEVLTDSDFKDAIDLKILPLQGQETCVNQDVTPYAFQDVQALNDWCNGQYNRSSNSSKRSNITNNANNLNGTIFPNPNNGEFKIELGPYVQNGTVSLFDLTGSLVDKDPFVNGMTINVGQKMKGVYIVMVKDENDQLAFREKVIIE